MASTPQLQQLAAGRAKGNQLIDQGIKLEQQGQVSRAISVYYDGIATIEEACALPFTPAELVTATPIIQKMQQTCVHARQNVQNLLAKQATTTSAPTSVASPTTSRNSFFGGAVGAITNLWQENLTDSGTVSSSQQRADQVRAQQARAEGALQTLGANNAASQLGPPTSMAGWADLLTEAALLPKPGMRANQPGVVMPLRPGLQNNNQGNIVKYGMEALQREPQQKWTQIKWCSSAEIAAQQARRLKKPLFIEIVVGRMARDTSSMRASALSEDRVIALINQSFVAVAINVTCEGFPKQHIPALQYAEQAYQTNWRYEFGFASCLMIDDSGQIPLSFVAGLSSVLSQQALADHFIAAMKDALSFSQQIEDTRRAAFSFDFAGAAAKRAALVSAIRLSFQRRAVQVNQIRAEMQSASGELATLASRFPQQ